MRRIVGMILICCSSWAAGVRGEETAVARQAAPWQTTPEMLAWAERQVPRRLPAPLRLQRLLEALLAPHGLALRETIGHSPTAAEAFAERRADCVGFAQLFVGLARALGLEVYFVIFEHSEGLERRGDLRVLVNHMAAGFGPADAMTVFDFGGRQPAAAGFARRISDATAMAIFFSNRGAERLLAGSSREALTPLRQALELDPSLSAARRNLGVALRRALPAVRRAPSLRP